MYFKFSLRKHPQSGRLAGYYRLIESYRGADNKVIHLTILNVGFMEEVSPEQLKKIQKLLTGRYEHGQPLFEDESDPVVSQYVEDLWQRIVASKKLDLVLPDKLSRMVNIDTLQHSNARDIGSENIAYQTWEKLQLTPLLLSHGFSQDQAMLAATQVVSRAVYPASELKTARWIRENSAVCELTGYDTDKVTKDKLYESALRLYKVKDMLEKHLSRRTNELFDLKDKIILYDITNTYFEGEKRNSKLAKFGRSKEKRNDARLVVLALVVNVEGFIKYSSILEGNIADCNTLSAMIEKLSAHTCGKGSVVVLDAGIATEENLKLIEAKGYAYLCVSRTKLKDYKYVPGRLTTFLDTKSKQTIRLRSVTTERNTDYYLEVKSPSKEKKEEGMKLQFEKRFEDELHKIQAALHTKGGVKKWDKVHQRIGRIRERYPSVQHYYDIVVQRDAEKDLATEITWGKDVDRHLEKNESLGVYFLRTNLDVGEEFVVWNIYNTIREIENAFRTLKTDLDLRPIYHKNDNATMAHLHLGILAYWLVNTVRYQLKQSGIQSCWSEIVRIGNTQKVITSSATNTYGKTIATRKCTVPNENLKQIYDILQSKHQPFTKRKSVVHKCQPSKTELPENQKLLSG